MSKGDPSRLHLSFRPTPMTRLDTSLRRRARQLAPPRARDRRHRLLPGRRPVARRRHGDVGGTIVVAMPGDVGTLLPPLVAAGIDREVTDLLFDRLAEIGDELNTVGDKGFKPQLAERWEWAPDSMSIAFHINPQARWHDGRPVRASDVRYSLNVVKDPALGSPRCRSSTNIDSVAVTRLAHRRGLVQAPHAGAVLRPRVPGRRSLPEHILGNTPAAQLKTAEVGAPRHRLRALPPRASGSPAQRIELVADTANYRGRAKLDRVVFAASRPTSTRALDALLLRRRRRLREPPRRAPAEAGGRHRASRACPIRTSATRYLAFNMRGPEAAVASPSDLRRPRRCAARSRWRWTGARCCRTCSTRSAIRCTGRSRAPSPSRTRRCPQIPYDTVRRPGPARLGGLARRPRRHPREEWPPAGVRHHARPTPARRGTQYAVLLQDAFRSVGANVKLDEVRLRRLRGEAGGRTASTARWRVYNTDPSAVGVQAELVDGGHRPATAPTSPRTRTPRWTRCSTAPRPRSIPRARRPMRAAPSRRSSRMRRASGSTSRPPSPASRKRIRTTAMRRRRLLVAGMADWWIPAAERNARDQIGLRAAQ